MAEPSSSTYLFGDLLALARQSWVRRMAAGLSERGYDDYRRSDALTLRLLRRGPLTIGRLGAILGVTRQAARKVADALAERDYARTERDARDARRVNIVLTPRGEAYARAVADVIEALNRELAERVPPRELAAADAVLRAAIGAEGIAARAAGRIAPPV